MFVIAGASGHTGGAAVEALLAQGRKVRVVVRDEAKGAAWRSRGAEVAVADLADAAALSAALAGAQAAYVLVPPQYGAADLIAAQRPIADALGAAVSRSGIPHVVLLSSIGAQLAEGNGPIRSLHYAESVLRRAAKGLTLLRAAYFLENWAPVLDEVRTRGVLPTFLTPGRPVPMVATQDIGRSAAAALVEPIAGQRVIELSGPREFTPEAVAAALGARAGRKIELLGLPLDAVEPGLTAAGFPAGTAKLFREMYDGVNSGRIDWEGGAAIARRGTLGPAEVLGPML